MSPTAIGLGVLLLLATACARQSGPSTTTVTSGTSAGPRTDDSTAMLLADEICAR